MADTFAQFQSGLESPAINAYEVLPSDTNNLTNASRAINVANGGMVRLSTVGGDTATVYIAAGIAFPIRATRIWQTGTTATGIAVLY